jgi:hypothetical protein
MENTNTPVFTEDQPEFFIPKGEGFQGPFRPSEIYQKVLSGNLSWMDHCYREKDANWIRIADHPVFRDLKPEAPKSKPAAIPPPFSPKGAVGIKWFLFLEGSQSGPYSESELERRIKTTQVSADAFAWNESMNDWKPLIELHPFKDWLGKPENKAERRTAPRKPLVAQVYVTNQKEVVTAMCRDVSVGGMQVLTDRIPGKAGDSVRLNVLPPSESGLAAFVAEGVIVRLLEDGRGFSFRFTRLSDESRQAIEEYVSW